MDRHLRSQIWQRADSRCEYCLMPQEFSDVVHEVDHIIAEKHRGLTEIENLGLACFPCNNHKGPNIAGIDPATEQITRLFNPRLDRWLDHFVWNGPVLTGLTAVGRTTIDVLAINLRHRVLLRRSLMDEGVFPP